MPTSLRLFSLIVVVTLSLLPAAPTAPQTLQAAPFNQPITPPATTERSASVGHVVNAPNGTPYVAGELLVRFTPDAAETLRQRSRDALPVPAIAALAQKYPLRDIKRVFPDIQSVPGLLATNDAWIALDSVYKLVVDPATDMLAMAKEAAAAAQVVYAEPNYVFEFDGLPDDAAFDQQWHLHNTGQYNLLDADIDAPEAWNVVTGTNSVVIAVIDTGVDREHPDLANTIWSNPGEVGGNGLDDDGNGYVDDTWGWNWVSNGSDPRDDNGHGTHVAGTAAAEGNNSVGVAGVCWGCKVMALKAFAANGQGNTSDIVQAINYAAQKGASIINMSFGSYAESQLLRDTLAAASGTAVLVAAAGNNGKNPNQATQPFYPAAYAVVLGVGATDVGCVQRDPITQNCLQAAEFRADFSNYGVNARVGAPGVSIYSTFSGGGYASLAGTSMAAPIVSGIAGLLLSQHPTWPVGMVYGQIIKTTDPISTSEFGRVNAYNAVTVVPTPDVQLVSNSIVYGDATGDADGIPDAGETFTLTMGLTNYWGSANGTSVTLSSNDPYVTILDNTATFGALSAYTTVRNTATPFRVSLADTAPNDHQVDFTLQVSANAGAYTTPITLSFRIQRVIEIPSLNFPAVITQNLTLHNNYRYIVKQNMLVSQGATLTIEPGTRLQFDRDKFMKIQGTLVASGTEELPIYFTSNQPNPQSGDFKGIIFDNLAVDATLVATPTVTIAVAQGATLPGIGTVISITNPPQFSVAGDVYFSAIISGTHSGEGIYRYSNVFRVVTPEIVAGDAAPNGGQFTGFDELYVSTYGDIYFIGQVTGGSATAGVYKKAFDGITAIAQVGDSVPGVSGGTFTSFKHLTVSEASGWVAFAGAYADGVGGTGIGLYVKRNDVISLLSVLFFNVGTVQDITAIWDDYYYGSPGANISGTTGGAVFISSYDSQYQQYYAWPVWVNNPWSIYSTPLGGVFVVGVNDRRYLLNGTWYTVMSISGGSVPRALFNCISPDGCNQPFQVVLKDGDPLPGGGTLNLSGTLDLAWDGSNLIFRAVVSGTNTMRLVRIMSDGTLENVFTEGFPLPDGSTLSRVGALPSGSFTNPYEERTLLVDTNHGQRILYTEPSNEYVSGSILKHVVLEYGGGLALEGAYPYISNSTFRYSSGIAFSGQNCPVGTIAVNRTDSGQLVFTHSHVVDNIGRGVYVQNSQGRVVIDASELSRNFDGGSCSGGGAAVLQSPITVRYSEVRYNVNASSLSGIELLGAYGRVLNSNISNNESWHGWNGVALSTTDNGPYIVQGNTISGNRSMYGAPAQGEYAEGGSALHVQGASAFISFNTIVGNRAYPNSRPLPGPAIMMYNYPGQGANQLTHNNVLNNDIGLFDGNGQPIPEYDLYLSNVNNSRKDMIATQNYWGTTDETTIKYGMIYDYDNDFAPGTAYFKPYLPTPEQLAPGFLLSATTAPPNPIGAETMTVTLDFSRDMNMTMTPTVTFGVVDPFTQHTIQQGQWVNAKRWVGTYAISADTGDGTNTLKVSGARDSGGMEIPEDTRSSFVIQTAGTSSVVLEAAGSVSKVALHWVQNDVADLAGYILYRSPDTNGQYTRIGAGMFTTTAFTDTDVANGQIYYYKYSVLDTDFNEVAWSNEVSVTPDDYTPPTTPAVSDDGATTNYFDRLHVGWISNDPETGIVEYQLCIGTSTLTCDVVNWTTMGASTATLRTGLNLVDGQTYYVNVQARNSANHWSAIGSSNGIVVNKLPAPVVAAVVPTSGVRTATQVITLTGSGFQTNPLPSVQLGYQELSSVSAIDATHLRVTVPQGMAAGVYPLTVTNFDTQIGTLSQAYTATNPLVGPRTLLFSPSPRQVGDDEASATMDVQIQEVTDLGAFQFDLLYDPTIVDITNVALSSFLSSAGRGASALGPQIDSAAGRVTFGGYSYGAGSGANGSGTLATITFSPKISGTTALTLTNTQLRDTLNSEIPGNLQNGQIQVVHYPFGDFNRDCAVDVGDIMLVANRWDTATGDPSYTPIYDFDSDGKVDVADIMQVAVSWGHSCTVNTPAQAPLFAPHGPALGVTGTTKLLHAGDEFTATVWLDRATNLAAYQLDVTYDPTRLAVLGVDYATWLGEGGNSVLALPPAIDNGAGRVTLGAFGYAGSRGADGAGVLGTVRLRALADGVQSLRPQQVQLVDQAAQRIAPSAVHEWQSAYLVYVPMMSR